MPASRLVTLLNERLWLRIFRFFSKQVFYRTTVYGCFRIIRIWLQKYKQGSVLKREFFIEKWVFLVCWYPVTLFEKDSLVGVLLKILWNFFIYEFNSQDTALIRWIRLGSTHKRSFNTLTHVMPCHVFLHPLKIWENFCFVMFSEGTDAQPVITCSKLTIETIEQGVKYVQS